MSSVLIGLILFSEVAIHKARMQLYIFKDIGGRHTPDFVTIWLHVTFLACLVLLELFQYENLKLLYYV